MSSRVRRAALLTLAAETAQQGHMAGLGRGRKKVVGGGEDQADWHEKGQVTHMFSSMASLAGGVLKSSSRQGGKSPQVGWLETLFQEGTWYKMCRSHQPAISPAAVLSTLLWGRLPVSRGLGGYCQWLKRELRVV